MPHHTPPASRCCSRPLLACGRTDACDIPVEVFGHERGRAPGVRSRLAWSLFARPADANALSPGDRKWCVPLGWSGLDATRAAVMTALFAALLPTIALTIAGGTRTPPAAASCGSDSLAGHDRLVAHGAADTRSPESVTAGVASILCAVTRTSPRATCDVRCASQLACPRTRPSRRQALAAMLSPGRGGHARRERRVVAANWVTRHREQRARLALLAPARAMLKSPRS